MGFSIYFMKAKVVDKNLSVNDIMKIDNCLQNNKEVEGVNPKIVEKCKKLRKNTYLPWNHELKKPLYTFIDYLCYNHNQEFFKQLIIDEKENGPYYEIQRCNLLVLRDIAKRNIYNLNYLTSRDILQFKEFYNERYKTEDQAIAFSKMEIYCKSDMCNCFFRDFSCFDISRPRQKRMSHINELYAQNYQIMGIAEEFLSSIDFTTEKLFCCSSYKDLS